MFPATARTIHKPHSTRQSACTYINAIVQSIMATITIVNNSGGDINAVVVGSSNPDLLVIADGQSDSWSDGANRVLFVVKGAFQTGAVPETFVVASGETLVVT